MTSVCIAKLPQSQIGQWFIDNEHLLNLVCPCVNGCGECPCRFPGRDDLVEPISIRQAFIPSFCPERGCAQCALGVNCDNVPVADCVIPKTCFY